MWKTVTHTLVKSPERKDSEVRRTIKCAADEKGNLLVSRRKIISHRGHEHKNKTLHSVSKTAGFICLLRIMCIHNRDFTTFLAELKASESISALALKSRQHISETACQAKI